MTEADCHAVEQPKHLRRRLIGKMVYILFLLFAAYCALLNLQSRHDYSHTAIAIVLAGFLIFGITDFARELSRARR